MAYEVSIVADSVAVHGGRLTTFQLRFPRFVLPQLNTHRALSKSARSSRAVPVAKILAEVEADPVIPISWGRNQRGMQAGGEMSQLDQIAAQDSWITSRNHALAEARRMMDRGAAKQIANRLLEPFMWADVVLTGTSFGNFFALRCHDAAQPEMQKLAVMMARAYRDSTPTRLYSWNWHLPYVSVADREAFSETRAKVNPFNVRHAADDHCLKLSAARCARVSYRAFDGTEPDPVKDVELHDLLAESGHYSPLEHQASPAERDERSGNFRGFIQYRQMLPVNVHEKFDFAMLDKIEGRDFIV